MGGLMLQFVGATPNFNNFVHYLCDIKLFGIMETCLMVDQ